MHRFRELAELFARSLRTKEEALWTQKYGVQATGEAEERKGRKEHRKAS